MKIVFRLGLSFAGAYLFPVLVADSGILFSYSHLSLLFMMCVYAVVTYTEKHKIEKRMRVFTHFLGAAISLMTACGFHLEIVGTVPYANLKWISSVVIFSEIYSRILQIAWIKLEEVENWLNQAEKTKQIESVFCKVITWFTDRPVMLIILFLICWTPCYLSSFPGTFYYDASNEFVQSVKGYSAEFPMLHSVLIVGFLKAGYWLTGSYNTGIAAFVILQMIILATLFAYILCCFKKKGKSSILIGISTAYFSLFPLIHVLVTTSVRDILFSGLLTYLVFQFYEIANNPDDFFDAWKKPVFLGLSIALTIFSRSNFVGLLPTVCLVGVSGVIYLLGRKRIKKGLVKFCVSLLGSYVTTSCILISICFPLYESTLNNSLSIFTQSIARAYFYEEENWTEDQKERFAEYFNMEGIKYVAENADKTKSYCTVDKNTIGPFLRFWVSMGVRYPTQYLDGILAHTLQMWFPGSPVDGYIESGDWGNEKAFFFVLDELEKPGVHRQWFPKIRAFYNGLGLNISYERIPVLSMLFSIGFHFWFLVNAMVYMCYRRTYYTCVPLSILLVYTLITSLSPLVYLRYYAALFMAFPVVFVLTMQPSRVVNETSVSSSL